MDVIETIGAFAGLASFLGLALVAFLQFMQGRHLRDLEDKATFVPEGLDLPTSPAPARKSQAAKVGASSGAVAAPDGAEEAERPVEAQVAQTKEAARQVEIARAAAERRHRFEQRRRPGAPPAPGGRPAAASARRGPDPRALVAIGLGITVLLVGVLFASGVIGGSEDSGSGGVAASGKAPAPTTIAVLNGTPVPALAAKIGQEELKPAGYKLGFVGNTEVPFDATTVEYDPADPANQKLAQTVAQQLQITAVEQMSADVKKAINGEPIVVIVGEDRAGT